jgi:hypothetical protein
MAGPIRNAEDGWIDGWMETEREEKKPTRNGAIARKECIRRPPTYMAKRKAAHRAPSHDCNVQLQDHPLPSTL